MTTEMTDNEALKSRCDALLLGLLGSEELIERWWAGDNIYFGLQSPASVFEKNPRAVYNYIISFCI